MSSLSLISLALKSGFCLIKSSLRSLDILANTIEASLSQQPSNRFRLAPQTIDFTRSAPLDQIARLDHTRPTVPEVKVVTQGQCEMHACSSGGLVDRRSWEVG